MKIDIVKVSPAMADEWLKGRAQNRSVSQARVDKMARDMATGEWIQNGEAIVIAKNGELLDGQHRLTACVQSGKSFTTVVVTGVDPDAIRTIDTGRSKSNKDVIQILGYRNSGALCAAIGGYIHSMRDGYASNFKTKPATVTAHEIDDHMKEHPEHKAIVERSITPDFLRASGISSIVAVMRMAMRELSDDTTAALFEEFVDSLTTGENLKASSPVYMFREKLIEGQANRAKKIQRREKAGMFVKTWNLWIRGEKCSQLRFRTDEDFPAVEGIPVDHVFNSRRGADLRDDPRPSPTRAENLSRALRGRKRGQKVGQENAA